MCKAIAKDFEEAANANGNTTRISCRYTLRTSQSVQSLKTYSMLSPCVDRVALQQLSRRG